MKAEAFRAAALKISGAIEAAHQNHPDFRVKGKVFASLRYPDADWGMVKLTAKQQKAFMKEAPETFVPCTGAWGKSGATNVHLASVQKGTLQQALQLASDNIVRAKSS